MRENSPVPKGNEKEVSYLLKHLRKDLNNSVSIQMTYLSTFFFVIDRFALDLYLVLRTKMGSKM